MKIPPFLLVIIVAIAVSVAFFKIYGRFTRPDVPLQVSATVENFAPGVAIGSSVKASKKKLSDVRWIQHLGFVGVQDRHDFALIRLATTARSANPWSW